MVCQGRVQARSQCPCATPLHNPCKALLAPMPPTTHLGALLLRLEKPPLPPMRPPLRAASAAPTLPNSCARGGATGPDSELRLASHYPCRLCSLPSHRCAPTTHTAACKPCTRPCPPRQQLTSASARAPSAAALNKVLPRLSQNPAAGAACGAARGAGGASPGVVGDEEASRRTALRRQAGAALGRAGRAASSIFGLGPKRAGRRGPARPRPVQLLALIMACQTLFTAI